MNQQELDEILAKPQVKRGLFIIRLAEVDPEDAFHQDLVYSLEACPPDSSDGDLVTAVRFIVTQAKFEAASEAAEARNAAKRLLRATARTHRIEGRISQSAAERLVEEESEPYWNLKVRSDLAEVRADFCKDLLYALEASLKNYQTSRADERAADSWHARTAT